MKFNNFIIGVYVPVLLLAQAEFIDRPCSDCHSPDQWYPLATNMSFNHNIETSFDLKNAHLRATCIQCHVGESVRERHQFQAASTACGDCHMDIHFNEFGSDCDRCHSTEHWDMTRWLPDHGHQIFPLDGSHAMVDCSACHGKPEVWPAGLLTTDCSICHQKQYNNALANNDHPENQDCILCHNSRAWIPIDMSQHDRLFPIYSGEHRGKWTTCYAECHIDPVDYSVFSCGLNGVCHEHRQSKMDEKHQDEGINNYEYNSEACYRCHPGGDEGD